MSRPGFRFLLSALIVVGSTPIHAVAQDGYFFRPPQATLAFRVGGSVPSANDAVFNFITNQLTVEKRDFRAISFGLDLGVRLDNHLDVALSGSYARSSTPSEFRHWTDLDDLPIEQETELWTAPVTLNLKYYLASRGRTLGKFAWVPNHFLPYIAVGGGLMFYSLRQQGDFVDFRDLAVFPATLESNGQAPMAQASVGADWWVASRFGLTVDGRYSWASATASPDFLDIDSRIHLSGFQVSTGLAVRF